MDFDSPCHARKLSRSWQIPLHSRQGMAGDTFERQNLMFTFSVEFAGSYEAEVLTETVPIKITFDSLTDEDRDLRTESCW